MHDATTARLKTRRGILRLAALGLAFLLIIGNAAIAFMVVRELHLANAQAERSRQAMLTLQEVDRLAEEGGKGQRVYRLFSDTRYLDAYRDAQLRLPAVLERLRALTAGEGDADQTSRLERLSMQIDEDRAALAAALTPVPRGDGLGFLPAEVASSMKRTDAISATVSSMLQNEQKLLGDRLAAIDTHDSSMLGTVAIGSLGSVVLIGVIFLLMRRDAGQIRQLAEAHSDALRYSELRFRRVFDESPLGMLLARQDGQQIVQANPMFCRMLGYGSGELNGISITDLVHDDDRVLLNDAIGGATRPDHVIEVRCLTRSREIAWTRVRLTQLGASGERQALLLALAEDVTREKQVEAELRQAQKMEAIGQLTGGIAHDFNNLLGVIIGNVEFLIDAVRQRPDEAELAREILNSALNGADLTRRLLAFARRQTLQPRRIDLNAYLPNHVAILRRVLGEVIRITPNFAENLWLIRADPSQVGDALLNLAINARDAMPRGGSITIQTSNAHVDKGTAAEDGGMDPGDYIVLAVTDTGTGMTPALLERVTEPFFTTKEPGAGSGLGLSMIYGFARQSGGHLRIASRLGHGTTVRLYLPRALHDAMDDHDLADDPSLPHGDESILLVDDNPELRAVGRRHLVSLGYRVTEAESGPAALALLRGQDHYDLLFTDVAMPHGMTGYQLAASARQLLPDLKVLFTTGYDGPETRTEPALPSPGAVIGKPYRREDLAITMRAALTAIDP
jgi:PAS domain S-box-containing protein